MPFATFVFLSGGPCGHFYFWAVRVLRNTRLSGRWPVWSVLALINDIEKKKTEQFPPLCCGCTLPALPALALINHIWKKAGRSALGCCAIPLPSALAPINTFKNKLRAYRRLLLACHARAGTGVARIASMIAYCVCIAGLCSRRARVSVVSRAAVRPRASIVGRGRAVSLPCDYRGPWACRCRGSSLRVSCLCWRIPCASLRCGYRRCCAGVAGVV